MPNSHLQHSKHAQIGNRLRAWRESVDRIPADLVRESDGAFQAHGWSQWEAGKIRISLDNALLLVNRYPGLSLDYIYRGKYEGLSQELYEKIRPRLLRVAEVAGPDTAQVVATSGKKRTK